MTPSARPSAKDRILDTLFGGPTTASDRAKALAERPPEWARQVTMGLLLVWTGLLVGWGLGALGWLPIPKEEFTLFRLLWVNGFGVVVQWINHGVAHHYRRKARQASKATTAQ